MDQTTERLLLIDQYRSYRDILHSRGIITNTIADEDLEKLSLQDLSQIVRSLKDLARTPSS